MLHTWSQTRILACFLPFSLPSCAQYNSFSFFFFFWQTIILYSKFFLFIRKRVLTIVCGVGLMALWFKDIQVDVFIG